MKCLEILTGVLSEIQSVLTPTPAPSPQGGARPALEASAEPFLHSLRLQMIDDTFIHLATFSAVGTLSRRQGPSRAEIAALAEGLGPTLTTATADRDT